MLLINKSSWTHWSKTLQMEKKLRDLQTPPWEWWKKSGRQATYLWAEVPLPAQALTLEIVTCCCRTAMEAGRKSDATHLSSCFFLQQPTQTYRCWQTYIHTRMISNDIRPNDGNCMQMISLSRNAIKSNRKNQTTHRCESITNSFTSIRKKTDLVTTTDTEI